jgi:hypothetical protein
MDDRYPINQRIRELMMFFGYADNVDGFYKRFIADTKEDRSERLRAVYKDINGIKLDFVLEITRKIGDKTGKIVNGHWLLTGYGSMFFEENITAATKSDEAAVKVEWEELVKDLTAFRKIAADQAQIILNLSAKISV